MYNGIGLSTVRGSATSGHVTKNMSYLKPEFFRNKLDSNQNAGRLSDSRGGKDGAHFKINKDVIEHNRKHAVEAKVFEFEDSLREGGGLTEDEIECRVEEYRAQLNGKDSNISVGDKKGTLRITDTHEISARKNEENERLRAAFGIRKDFVSGSSFDPAAQEQRRKDRDAERAARIEQNKADRARRDQLRGERMLLRESADGDMEESGRGMGRGGAGGRRGPHREERQKYIPKDRSNEGQRGNSRSRSRETRKRGRSNSRSRSSDRRDRRARDSRSRRDSRRSVTPPPSMRQYAEKKNEGGEHDEQVVVEKVVDCARQKSRSPSRYSSDTSSSSGRHTSSGSSSRSSSQESDNSRGMRRRASRSPERRSSEASPPRRKTRWGSK